MGRRELLDVSCDRDRRQLIQYHAARLAPGTEPADAVGIGRPRGWKVVWVDWDRKVVQVEPSIERGRSRWFGSSAALSPRLCEAVRQVLIDTSTPSAFSQRAEPVSANSGRSCPKFARMTVSPPPLARAARPRTAPRSSRVGCLRGPGSETSPGRQRTVPDPTRAPVHPRTPRQVRPLARPSQRRRGFGSRGCRRDSRRRNAAEGIRQSSGWPSVRRTSTTPGASPRGRI